MNEPLKWIGTHKNALNSMEELLKSGWSYRSTLLVLMIYHVGVSGIRVIDDCRVL